MALKYKEFDWKYLPWNKRKQLDKLLRFCNRNRDNSVYGEFCIHELTDGTLLFYKCYFDRDPVFYNGADWVSVELSRGLSLKAIYKYVFHCANMLVGEFNDKLEYEKLEKKLNEAGRWYLNKP